MLSYSQKNYLSNVLIVKAKESFRGYFHKGETSNLKLESLYKAIGVTSISRTYPNSKKPRSEINELGIKYKNVYKRTKLTTLDAITLHRELDNLKNKKINFLAMEASSHALEQKRMDKVKVKFALFTNLSRDHLDYHKDMKKYFSSKKRLFESLLDKKGKAVICNITKTAILCKVGESVVDLPAGRSSVISLGQKSDFYQSIIIASEDDEGNWKRRIATRKSVRKDDSILILVYNQKGRADNYIIKVLNSQVAEAEPTLRMPE